MKPLQLCIALVLANASYAQADRIVDFDELNPSSGFFDGYGFGASSGSWESQGAVFNTNQYGPGWSYSNVQNITTGDYTNQYAAFTEFDFSGTGNYVVGSAFAGGAFIDLPTGHFADSVRVTNTTYAAQSILHGDAYAKRFGGDTGNDPDFFKLTFTGHRGLGATGATTGSVVFYLADYRFADNSNDYVVDTWELLDLTGLGDARSIELALDSSDVGGFGMNTPAFFAIDELSLTTMPEPNSAIILLATGAFVAVRRRR